jgi:undecaprenol kinase/diacylglycerol kinase (ATP)
MLGKKIYKIRYALNGLRTAWVEELSFKLQIISAVIVLGAGWMFNFSPLEWILIVFAIGFVLAAEVFNTALEELCDKFKSDPDPHIAKIKDLSAAAVLLASGTALLIGIIVFFPYVVAVL